MDEQKSDTAQTQNTPINAIPASAEHPISAENKAPIAPSQQKEKQLENENRIYIIIAIFFLVLILGELGFAFLYHGFSFKNILQSPLSMLSKTKSKNNTTNTNTQPSIQVPLPTIPSNVIIPVPTGEQAINGTGATSGFIVQVEKVTENPTGTSGDKPTKGLQYIEFDVSVTNNTNKATLVPGMFYFQDATIRKLFMPADMFGYLQDSKIIFSFSQKNITVLGKQSLYTTIINPGQTASRYLIYQIPPGEKGQLVWDDSYLITEIPAGQKVAQANTLALAQSKKPPQPLQYTFSNPSHDNKIVVFSLN